MFSPLFERALRFAIEKHGSQMRRGSEVPYVTHLVHVAHIVARHGGDEEMVAAALLHDVIEDTPVELDELEDLFGRRVAGIVSDVTEEKKILDPDDRRRHTVDSLRTVGAPSRTVKAADVLHNMRTTLQDLESGEEVWSRFRGGRAVKIQYYADVLDALGTDWEHDLLEEGARTLKALEKL